MQETTWGCEKMVETHDKEIQKAVKTVVKNVTYVKLEHEKEDKYIATDPRYMWTDEFTQALKKDGLNVRLLKEASDGRLRLKITTEKLFIETHEKVSQNTPQENYEKLMEMLLGESKDFGEDWTDRTKGKSQEDVVLMLRQDTYTMLKELEEHVRRKYFDTAHPSSIAVALFLLSRQITETLKETEKEVIGETKFTDHIINTMKQHIGDLTNQNEDTKMTARTKDWDVMFQ